MKKRDGSAPTPITNDWLSVGPRACSGHASGTIRCALKRLALDGSFSRPGGRRTLSVVLRAGRRADAWRDRDRRARGRLAFPAPPADPCVVAGMPGDEGSLPAFR